MLKLYLAAPLFSLPERRFNEDLTGALSEHFEVYLPQRDGALMVNLIASGWSQDEARRFVFRADIDAIKRSDVVVAIVDGPAVDDGVSFELGLAFALEKPCFGLATDFRRQTVFFNNPMWSESLQHLFCDVDSLRQWAQTYQSSLSKLVPQKV